MRIVHLVTRSHRRGAEVVALELAGALAARGDRNEVHAMALAVDGQALEELPPLVETARVGARAYLQSARRLRQIVSTSGADVVIAHGGAAALVVAFAVPAGTAKVWQRILGFPRDRWGPARRAGWRTVARRFDGVVALTTELETEVRSIGYRGPVWVIPNARAPERFTQVDRTAAAVALRASIGVPSSTPMVGFVAHLVDQKHPEAAVEVLAELRRRGVHAHLVVAGDGPSRPAVERRVEALGVAGHVTLLGHRDDPEVVFAAVDVTIITSRAEGLPGVAIEAQMAGCPIVSYPVGGICDVVDEGITGRVLPRADVSLMADTVAALLDDPSERAAMGRAARARSERFTIANAASLYASAFAQVVKTPPQP